MPRSPDSLLFGHVASRCPAVAKTVRGKLCVEA
jgi:hypothetical protein